MPRATTVLLIAGLLLSAATRAAAQTDHAVPPPMEALAALHGEWSGTGWIQSGPARVPFLGHELVTPKLGGRVLLIEGTHRASDDTDHPDRIVHHALGVLSFDEASGSYRLQAHLADGRRTDAVATWSDETLSWEMTSAPATVRYRATVSNGVWSEVGEVTTDGVHWRTFFSMELRRVRP